MKKFSLFLIVIFFISAVSSFQPLNAQEKTKEEQERDAKIQQSIDQQKKAMAEQKKAIKVEAQILKEQSIEIDSSVNDAHDQLENANKVKAKIYMDFPRGNRSFTFDEPFDISGPDMQAFYGKVHQK